jgi:hypothetical protein
MSPRLRRAAPTLLAGVLALAYVVLSPPSRDLAAHLLRAKLFGVEGFGLWSNWWYGGHDLPGYSVLFPPLAYAFTPQLVAAVSATATAALFTPLAEAEFGERAWIGSLWFAAGTATNLYTGRLTFAFGLLPAVAALLAWQRGRLALACALGVLTALASPVAALFLALAGGAVALSQATHPMPATQRLRRAAPGLAVAAAALLPVLALAKAFPEGGTEPFPFTSFWPVIVVCALAVVALPKEHAALRAGALLYGLGTAGAYVISTPVGSNAARLAALIAGPLAALALIKRRPRWLLVALLPLAVLQWQDPVADLSAAVGDPTTKASYWQPLVAFLERARTHGAAWRVEVPFTDLHWEADYVASHAPLARGWERQLDIKDNHLFYAGRLTPAAYRAWLGKLAVRYVAVADSPLDASARQEGALIDRGLPYLHLVERTRHFRIYEVANATPMASGAVTVTDLRANSVTLNAVKAGRSVVRVRWTPYWRLGAGSGCVFKAGDFTGVDLRRPGRATLVIAFALNRIGADSPRCTTSTGER